MFLFIPFVYQYFLTAERFYLTQILDLFFFWFDLV